MGRGILILIDLFVLFPFLSRSFSVHFSKLMSRWTYDVMHPNDIDSQPLFSNSIHWIVTLKYVYRTGLCIDQHPHITIKGSSGSNVATGKREEHYPVGGATRSGNERRSDESHGGTDRRGGSHRYLERKGHARES